MNKVSYICGKTYASQSYTNPMDLPVGTVIDASNPKTEFYRSPYHWVKFEKIGADNWRIKSVWFVSETETYQEVKSDRRYTTSELLELVCRTYTFNGKKYTDDSLYIQLPVFDENGDMRCLIFDDNIVTYRKSVNTLSLLRECADDYSRTYIKFRYDNKEDMTINIIKGKMKYLITCTETEFDTYCEKVGIKIHRSAFNTYL